MWQYLKSAFDEGYLRFKKWIHKRTVIGTIFLIYAALPDYDGRNHWWITFWHKFDGFLWIHNRWIFILIGLFLIWLDNRRLVRLMQAKPYDENTLKGRTLKLRDDIKEFLDKSGQKVEGQFDGETQVGYIKRIETSNARRVSRLIHGYELNFAERVQRVYHEYGALGWNDTELNEVMLRPFKNEKSYNIAIAALGRLAEQTMVMDAYPHLTWREINNMTSDELKKIIDDPEQVRKFNALPRQEWS
jgi:hypothetical protein